MDLSDPSDREALALFIELEQDPRRAKAFSDDTHALARMLGLTDEWWRGQHVNDCSSKPSHPPGYCAHDDFFRCRAVREVLLAEAKKLLRAAE